MITGTTKLLGVIGYPIEHSLSPIMQNAAIAALGVNYVYVPFAIQPNDLATAISGFEAIGVQGFNITIPHKQAIRHLLNDIDPLAMAIGAVNTVWRTPTGWHGTNTDITGFLAPLRTLGRDWGKTQVIVLGNGGAARAVVAGCMELGCAEIRVFGRDRQKLQAFQQSWHQSPIQIEVQIHLWEELPAFLPTASLIVNTTPIGMYPHINDSPLPSDWMTFLEPGAIAYDLIYTPSPTCFLKLASHHGAIAIDGLEMLVCQGAAALEIWLQQSVPLDVMRRSLQHHLGLL